MGKVFKRKTKEKKYEISSPYPDTDLYASANTEITNESSEIDGNYKNSNQGYEKILHANELDTRANDEIAEIINKSSKIDGDYENSNQDYVKIMLEAIESMCNYNKIFLKFYESFLQDAKQEPPGTYAKYLLLKCIEEFPEKKFNDIKEKSGESKAKQSLVDDLQDIFILKYALLSLRFYNKDKKSQIIFNYSDASIRETFSELEKMKLEKMELEKSKKKTAKKTEKLPMKILEKEKQIFKQRERIKTALGELAGLTERERFNEIKNEPNEY